MNVETLKLLLKTNDLVILIAILKCCLVIPVTSVPCEHGFSTQNHIKTKKRTSTKSEPLRRTSMKSEPIDDLMRISEDGPMSSRFDFIRTSAVSKFFCSPVTFYYSILCLNDRERSFKNIVETGEI